MRKRALNRALIDATLLDDVATMKELLEAGADADSRDPEHQETALMLTRSERAARLLVESGADVNARDDRGLTPLMRTPWRFLPDSGADPNAVTEYGETSLIMAVESADADKVGWLLEAGADVNYRNSDGRSALDRANDYGMTWLVSLLRDSGARG